MTRDLYYRIQMIITESDFDSKSILVQAAISQNIID